jgi:hypothetical protein
MEHSEEKIETETSKEKGTVKSNFLIKWLRYKSRRIRLFFLVGTILLGLTVCAFTSYLCIYLWLPQLWSWGFEPVTWRSVFSAIGAFYLVVGGLSPLYFMWDIIDGLIAIYAEEAEKEFNDKLNNITKKQNSYEEKLESNDKLGLIPLVTYSRIELEQYYKIGLTQTQKSYSYSIISMWIGFIIIIFGIVLYLFPSQFTKQDVSADNFHLIAIGSGVMTEFISALFLWIYKSSINNLTYFYNRQIFIHNTLLAFKLSESMTDGDAAKKVIIEKILDFGFKANSPFDLKSSRMNKAVNS